MWSLKSRLLAGMVSGMAVLLIIFSLVIYHSIRHAFFSQFDTSLESAAQILSASVEQHGGRLGFEFDAAKLPEFAGKTKLAYYEFWRNDGVAMGKSPSLGKKDLVQFKSVSRFPAFKTFKMENGQHVRAVAVEFMPRFEEKDPNAAQVQQSFTLVVAKDARNLLAQLQFLKYLLSITSIGIVGAACGVALAVVRQGLKPLNAVAAQIDSIRENNLSSRISGEYLPAEIAPIQRRLNSLLDRLEASFQRERTFNADVAHELRTPLAGLRSIVDVTLTRVRDAAEYQSALTDCLSIVSNMQAMVANLMTLARVESGQMTFGKERVNIYEMVNSCWQPFAAKAAQACITFESHLGSDTVCESDVAGLSMVFSNLLDNAVEYTNHDGRIQVTSGKAEGRLKIVFENTGTRLAGKRTEDIFEPFWRGDLSRSGTGVHCGLGLALAKRIVEALGGSIHAEVSNDLFSVCIMLPHAPY
jgi:signal transduction histidine kinase